jgi:hypothetical protein
MPTHTRRNLLRNVGLTAIGSLGLTGLGAGPAAAASSGQERIAVVNSSADGQVLVDGGATVLPVEGFPDGWQLLAGDKVAVAPSLSHEGLAAFPVAHWIAAEAAPSALRPGARFAGSDGPAVTSATILAPGLAAAQAEGKRDSRFLLIHVADRVSSVGTDRALAIREG